MRIREAGAADGERLRALYTEFVGELPPPPGVPFDLEHELRELEEYLGDEHVALVAEDDGGEIVGFALAKLEGHPAVGYLSDIYVAPGSRRQGAARKLIREVMARLQSQGAQVLALEVQVDNADARAAYERLGFRTTLYRMLADAEQLLERASREPRGDSFGSVHVQTDDENAVERAVTSFLPRVGRSAWTDVTPASHDWVTVTDELCDRDRSAQRRLGTELSERLGVPVVAFAVEEEAVVRFLLFDRGRMVDEYLSVPSYYGDLNKADELSLAANPTLVARLTGADPTRVRAVARVASSPSELPPARELLAELAAVMNLEARIDR
jgi:ribosomal protein S18 acetylase RimI-like enzyme